MIDVNGNRVMGRNDNTACKKSLELARKELRSIIGRIEGTASLTDRSLTLLRARRLLGRSSNGARRRLIPSGRHLWILAILASILAQLAWNYGRAAHHHKCLAEMPPFTQKIFRPAEDCSICRDVQQVDRISNVDPSTFEERYAYSGRPVVVMDATINWTATKVFSFPFFKSLYDGVDADCQFFPYRTEFKSLQDVLDMGTDRSLLERGTEPWYVGWSNCDEEIGSLLRQHYQRPYFLPVTAETEKTDWIFMGSHGYGAPMHVDDVEHPSWQAQIKGEKLWILDPPRECHYACNRLEVVVHPGEIIVLDTNRWYHQTVIVSEEMSITIGAEYD
ncbi:uncharacterized protein LOC100869100 [Apis florea]|uniref:uncharacterized protein LOC100869100 n=1 Tax=Apis florea TaxID=7463 RepID=UPI00062911B0|nr:uncharacterized protein LOC100869100 [Apis florea]